MRFSKVESRLGFDPARLFFEDLRVGRSHSHCLKSVVDLLNRRSCTKILSCSSTTALEETKSVGFGFRV